MLDVLQVFFQRAGSAGGAWFVEWLASAPCVAVHFGTKGGGMSSLSSPATSALTAKFQLNATDRILCATHLHCFDPDMLWCMHSVCAHRDGCACVHTHTHPHTPTPTHTHPPPHTHTTHLARSKNEFLLLLGCLLFLFFLGGCFFYFVVCARIKQFKR